MNIGDLYYALRADGAQLSKDVQKEGAKAGDQAATSFKSSFKKAFSGSEFGKGLVQGLGLAGALGIANLTSKAISGVVDVIGDSVKAASDLSESQSKVGVVFANSAKEVENWSDKAAEAMGISKQAALEQASTLGNLLLSMGKTSDEAAKMSMRLVQLAADIGSFNNVDTEEVLMAIRSGLTGEIAPLRRFGVNLTEAALKAKAMALGLSDGKATLDASAKSAAAYALILEQTTTAQGDFARTAGGLANQTRTMNAQFEDASAELGENLIPLVITLEKAIINLSKTVSGKMFGGRTELFAGQITEQIGRGNSAELRKSKAALQKGIDDLYKAGAGRLEKGNIELLKRLLAQVDQALEDPAKAAAQTVADKMYDELEAHRIQMQGVGEDLGRAVGQGAAKGLGAQAGLIAAQAQKAFSKLPQNIADRIRSRRQLVRDAWQQLLDTIKEHKGVNEQAYTVGHLVSKTLVKALKSGDPLIKAQAQATQKAFLDRLAQVVPENGKLGKKALAELNKAMKSKDPEVRDAARKIKDTIEKGVKPDTKQVGDKTTDAITGALRSGQGPIAAAAYDVGRLIAKNLVAGMKGDKVTTSGGHGGGGSRSGGGNKPIRTAGGGLVPWGQPYISGEHGRELNVPTPRGVQVFDTQDTAAIMSRGFGGYDSHDVFNVNVGHADRKTIGEIRREMQASSARKRMRVSMSGGGLG